MLKSFISILGLLTICLTCSGLYAQQPADGENEYALAAVNPRFIFPDTIDTDAGRGVWVAENPDLDGDGLPEILVTEYLSGGRVLVFEVVADNTIEFVWASKILTPGVRSAAQTPRSVITGDFDKNGKMEIWFQIGTVTTDSLARALRGIYIYEFTGEDNNYGEEPIKVIPFEEIDPNFDSVTVMRTTESGMILDDIDGDGKVEFIYPPRAFNFTVANLYILEAESGTFENGDINIETEFVYTDMAFALPPVDGYVPVGAAIGDVDSDGLDEIVVAGWTNISSGAGLGFIEISGPDTYIPGSVVPLVDDFSPFVVKAKPLIIDVNGSPVIFLHGRETPSRLWIVEGIVSDQFVSSENVKTLMRGVGAWSAWDWGDQDHPVNSSGDGFDLYLNGGPFSPHALLDIEYNGGEVTDSTNYTIHTIFDLDDVYDNSGGLWNDVFTYPGMDLDKDGLRDLVASYKGSFTEDTLNGNIFNTNTYAIFFFEWGDSTQSIDLVTSVPRPQPLTIITPDDYHLEQNYPNPFNPTTNITFSLPFNKRISLKIYNSLGQEVRTLIESETYPEGTHTVQWDATDDKGNRVASGVYVYKLIFGNFSKSKTMTLTR